MLPTIFELLHEVQNKQGYKLDITDTSLTEYSLGIAGVLIVVYLLNLLYSFTAKPLPQQTSEVTNKPVAKETDEKKQWTLSKSLLIMAGSTLLLIYMSDLLVGSVQHVIQNFHISEIFLGIILIPLLSDVAEHVVGIQMAYKNKMDLSMSISLESATQIALFVAPVLVFISFFMGKEMNLFFSPFEVVILGLSVFIINQISEDGESINPATERVIMVELTPAASRLKYCLPFLSPPNNIPNPGSTNKLPSMAPTIDAFTKVTCPALSAIMVKISSAALPKVAFNKAPILSLV